MNHKIYALILGLIIFCGSFGLVVNERNRNNEIVGVYDFFSKELPKFGSFRLIFQKPSQKNQPF